MPAEVIIPALAGALDSFLGFGSNQSANKTNMRMNRENLAAAKEMQNTQMQFQKDMYEDAKMYNSPLNQRRLNEAAGLNPFQTLGQGSFQPVQAMSGGSGSVPSMNPVHAYQPNLGGAASAYFDSRVKQEQIEAMRYQNDMKELTYQTELQDKIETILNKRVKTDTDYQTLRILRQEYDILLKTKNYRISQSRADATKVQAEADQLNFDYFMSRILAPVYEGIQQNEYNIGQAQLKKLKAETEKVYQEIDNLVKKGILTDAEAEEVRQGITINKPLEYEAEDIAKMWKNPKTRKVQQFTNRFNNWLQKFNPLRGFKSN